MFVQNAGLVLLNAFLPRLFERLSLLTPGEDGARPRIAGAEAISRAVHLLQYLAEKRLDRPEPELVLNKVLCGVPTSQPIQQTIEPRPSDLETCEELLRAVIANWPALRSASPAALRETFLQREGRLQRGDMGWTLQVQRMTVDVLIDQIPWSFSLILLPWMTEPLRVSW